TTSLTAFAMIAAAPGTSGLPAALANSTSVTAWVRGRLPTWVVRMGSVLRSMGIPGLLGPIGIVGRVIARQPPLQVRVGIGATRSRDLVGSGVILRELQNQTVGIGDVHRAAVAMLEHECLRRHIAGLLQAPLDLRLSVAVDVQSDVMKGTEGHLRPELPVVLRLRELEERERPAVADAKEKMAVDALRAEELIDFAPGGHQRQADDVLIELARRLEVMRDVGVVMQAGRQLCKGG